MIVAPATHGLAAHGLVPYGLASTDPFYRFGEYLRENQDQVVEKATDPTYLIGGLFGLLLAAGLAAGVVVGILFLASRLLYRLQELTLPPGTITFGPRREHAYDYVVGPPVRQELKDSALHNEILGPAGQGKTTLMELMAVVFMRFGITVFVHETSGDLGRRLVRRARALGKRIYVFDPGSLGLPGVYKWNPVAGDPELAAEQAVAAMNSASGSADPFFRGMGERVLRNAVLAASAYAREVLGTEPTLPQIGDLLSSEEDLELTLGARRPAGVDSSQPPVIDAPWLPNGPRRFFANVYYNLRPEERLRYLLGVQNAIEAVLARGIVRQALSPVGDEPALELQKAMDSGGLVVFRADPAVCGQVSSKYLSMWGISDFCSASERRAHLARSEGKKLPYVAAFFDELHVSLGKRDSEIAEKFAEYTTLARHYHVYLTVAFQAYALLAEIVKETLAANAANRFLSGRTSPKDAKEAQEITGLAERDVKDRRSHSEGLEGLVGAAKVVTTTFRGRQPRKSADEIRHIPKKRWLYVGTRDGDLQEPVIFKAIPPKEPEPPTSGPGQKKGLATKIKALVRSLFAGDERSQKRRQDDQRQGDQRQGDQRRDGHERAQPAERPDGPPDAGRPATGKTEKTERSFGE